MFGLQLDGVLGVLGPGEVVLLLLILLVVEMASSSSPLFPLARDDLIPRVFKFLDFNGGTAVNL